MTSVFTSCPRELYTLKVTRDCRWIVYRIIADVWNGLGKILPNENCRDNGISFSFTLLRLTSALIFFTVSPMAVTVTAVPGGPDA